MRRQMDAGTIVLVVLAAIIILAAIAIIAQAISSNRKASAEAYSVRMSANAAVVSRMAGRNDHAIDIDYYGVLTITPRDQSDQPTAQPQQAAQVSSDEPQAVNAWQEAVKVIEASIRANGPTETHLISGEDYGSGGAWQAAKNVLQDNGLVMVMREGKTQRTVVTDGDLSSLLTKVALKSAITSLPRRS